MALFLVIVANMFYLQIIKHDEYEGAALNQQTQDTEIAAKRGNILDRSGNEIAISASEEDSGADNTVSDPPQRRWPKRNPNFQQEN